MQRYDRRILNQFCIRYFENSEKFPRDLMLWSSFLQKHVLCKTAVLNRPGIKLKNDSTVTVLLRRFKNVFK